MLTQIVTLSLVQFSSDQNPMPQIFNEIIFHTDPIAIDFSLTKISNSKAKVL